MIAKSLAEEIAFTERRIRERRYAIRARTASVRQNISRVLPVVAYSAASLVLVLGMLRSLFRKRTRPVAGKAPPKGGIDVLRLVQLGLSVGPVVSEIFSALRRGAALPRMPGSHEGLNRAPSGAQSRP